MVSDARSGLGFVDGLAIALTSASSIAAQIALTRVLSITLWHHFAFLVVGVALLGFGVAGSWLYARGGVLRPGDGSLRRALARRAMVAAAASLLAVLAALTIRPNALELFRDPSVALSLSLIIVLDAVPFVGAGVILGTALGGFPQAVGRVYAADLVGGGVAAAGAATLIGQLGALGVLVAAVVSMAGASLLFARGGRRPLCAVLVALFVLGAVEVSHEDAWIAPAPTKELAFFSLPQFGGGVEWRQWTANGRVDVSRPFDGPPLLAGEVGGSPGRWRVHMVTQDGSAPTTMHRVSRSPAELTFLAHATTAAFWAMRAARFGPANEQVGPAASALIIGVGGGADLMTALGFGARPVVGVEVNPAIATLLTGRYRRFTGNVAGAAGVRIVRAEGRAFVHRSQQRYDLIELAGVDTFTASASGARALSEAYLYTREAFEDFLAHLTADGCLSISRLILDPPRETLRLAVTAEAALERRGASSAWRHIFVLHAKRWSTLLACTRAIEDEGLARLRQFAGAEGFTVAFDPGATRDGPFARAITGEAPARADFIAAYPYRIEPATDEAPFFFNYFRWRSAPELVHMTSGSVYSEPVPIALGVLLLTLLLTVSLAIVGILRPLRRLRLPAGCGWPAGGYFALLGGGYLLVEIALLERLGLLLGDPTHTMAVVLGSLLVSSGLGAALSRRWLAGKRARSLAWAVGLGLLAAAGASHWLVPALMASPLWARVLAAVAMVAPVGLLLGMPFPHGLRRLVGELPELVPWAYGVNAFAMVAAAALAPLLALSVGHSALLLLAAAFYAAAFAALSRWRARLPSAASRPSATKASR